MTHPPHPLLKALVLRTMGGKVGREHIRVLTAPDNIVATDLDNIVANVLLEPDGEGRYVVYSHPPNDDGKYTMYLAVDIPEVVDIINKALWKYFTP